MESTEGGQPAEYITEGKPMALSGLYDWGRKPETPASACGTACGASDKPAEEKPAACGASDKK